MCAGSFVDIGAGYLFEAISLGGADNIIIPFGTLFIIMKITTKPIPEIILQLCSIGIIFLLTYLIASPSGRLGHSGIIGVSLAGYAAWSLIGPAWYNSCLYLHYFDCMY